MVGFMAGNFVLQQCFSRAVKQFATIKLPVYLPKYSYPHSNTLFHIFTLQAALFCIAGKRYQRRKTGHHRMKSIFTLWCQVVYRRIYCHRFLTSSSQTSHYIRKYIRISDHKYSKFLHAYTWAPSSEFVSSSILSWSILTVHAQPFRGSRDLAFCLKVPLNSPLVWASSGGSGETARMCRLAWTFAARIWR